MSSSFLIYNQTQLQKQVANWKTKLPWISPHYAIKSNPIGPLIDDITKNKVGFDCASKREIRTALRIGTPANKIVYSNSIKEEKDILYAQKKGVLLTTADSIEELIKIQKTAPEMKILWRIAIKEDNSEQLATVFSNKFGDDFINLDQIKARFKQIRDMGIKLEGIHFHCGSGQHGSTSFKEAIDIARSCIEQGRKLGHNMTTLDLGGGFPAGDLTKAQVDILKATYNDPLGYEVMAEPGRHFSSSSCHLATRVIGKREKQGRLCYHINDSIYHSFNCVIMDGFTLENDKSQFYSKWNDGKSIQTLQNSQSRMQDGSIFGMTCDGYDIVARNAMMPELNVGDWLVIGGMGSYTYGPKSSFNGMKSSEKIIVWRSDRVREDKKSVTESEEITPESVKDIQKL